MNQQRIPIILVVENHWLLGKVHLGREQRMLDALNDSSTEYIHLDEVTVFSSADRKHCLASPPTMAVPKRCLQLAISPTDRFEIPKKNRVHKIVEKSRADSALVAAGYLIQGVLHLKMRTTDAHMILSEMLGRFFPVTTATVGGPGRQQIQAAAVLVNKDCVSCISCGASQAGAALPAVTQSSAAHRRLEDSITAQLLVEGL